MILKSLPLWGEGAPVRTLGRMRGQSEEQASLEELCRAGARPRRPVPLLSSRRTREGELPRRGKRSWPGPRLGAPFRKGFALRGEFLFHVEKEPKDARGSAQDGHSVSIFAAPPRTPLRGTRTCWVLQNFRRAKFEWRFLVQSGPLGPGAVKNCGWCGSTSAPGFVEPTLPVQILAGAPRGSPTQILHRFRCAVGEGLAPPDDPLAVL